MITYEAYGLDPVKAEEFSVKDLSVIRDVLPELYYVAVDDDPQIKELIDRWEAVKITDIGHGYAVSRGWNNWMAVREFIQNALDEEHILFGYDNIRVQIYFDDMGLHIINRGRAIKLEHWFLRPTKKEEWVRGKFGEGMDVASETLIYKGYRVYIFSHSAVYKPVYTPSGQMAIVMGLAKQEIDGTHVIVMGMTPLSLEVGIEDIIIQELAKRHKVLAKYTVNIKGMPNTIYKFFDVSDRLYVRDIYVNEMKSIFHYPSFYVYNLWWVDLESNRRMPSSSYDVIYNIADIIKQYPEAYADVLYACVHKEFDKALGIDVLRIECNYFEVNSYSLIDEIPNETWEKIIDILLDKIQDTYKIPKSIVGIASMTDLHEISLSTHVGVVPLIVPSRLYNKMSIGLKTVNVLYLETVLSATEKRHIYKPNELKLKLYRYVVLTKELGKAIGIKDLEVVVTDQSTSSYMRKGKIFLAKSDLEYRPYDAIFEELGHAYGFEVMGIEASDASSMFTKALKNMFAEIMLWLRNYNNRYRFDSIMKGLINNTKTPDGHLKDISRALINLQMDLSEKYPDLEVLKHGDLYEAFQSVSDDFVYLLERSMYPVCGLVIAFGKHGSVIDHEIVECPELLETNVDIAQRYIDSKVEEAIDKVKRYAMPEKGDLIVAFHYNFNKGEFELYKYYIV